MAFSNPLSGRIDELRFPNLRSPDVETPFSAAPNASRDSSPFFHNLATPNTDVRGTLQRRFTTDSSKLALGRPFSQQYNSFNAASMKQRQLYEDIQDARRKAQEQLALLDLQERNLQLATNPQSQDMDRLVKGFNRVNVNGPVSEPTTPPDYSEDVFSNRFSRSSRLSSNSIMSPPGLAKRTSQSSSKVMSPSDRNSHQGLYSTHRQSTKSMPGSRRGSDEDEYDTEDLPAVRSAATLNRFSMPVKGSRESHRLSTSVAPVQNHTPSLLDTSFLLEGDEDTIPTLGPVAQAYAQLGGDDFPTLNMEGGKLSANSAALDLANSRAPDAEWTAGSRPHKGHASMPHTDSSMYRPVLNNLSNQHTPDRPADLPRRKSQRHSVGVTFDEATAIPPVPGARPASLQTSYSTNDVPTVKTKLDSVASPVKSLAEQQFYAHNISMGRIPANAANNRQSRELASSGAMYRSDENPAGPTQSNLQACATPFGPTYTSSADANGMTMTSPVGNGNTFLPQPAFQYNMSAFVPSNGSQFPTNANNTSIVGLSNGYNMYNTRPQENQNRVNGAGRRNNDESRFNNAALETYRNSLYELCKDQHGCRYLQRKLEDGQPDHVQMIFQETCPHITELMTDPFGNYLCQKLFEHCKEEQRTALIDTAAPALSIVALNQHGTRALQKMIEFVHTDQQIDKIIQALSPRVVELVQDLNGNHVIQKCLTRLGAERCQFIYDAVGSYCVVVGTHRHGCCVIQRCIDHSQGDQRAELIHRITNCAFDLVQDPFGNYVVQYILDLDEAQFTNPLCDSFEGKVVALSKQKFSSNVIEKCLRTASMEMKRKLVEEMLPPHALETMLRDSFANYVVQTAIDYSDLEMKVKLVELIRPLLPSIRQTPHGRRIATKILGSVEAPTGGALTGASSFAPGPVVTSAAGSSSIPTSSFSPGRNNRRQVQIVGGGFNRAGYTNGINGSTQNTGPQPNSNGGYYGMPGVNNGYNATGVFNGYQNSVPNGHNSQTENYI